jgi:peptidoglycan L-alanyl-D-glutamate endopeptidase CwlK
VSKFELGTTSRHNLVGVHPLLVRIIELAIRKSAVDFKVIEGVRTPARQAQLYAQGRSTPGKIVTWTLNSNHFKSGRTGYGHAVDLLPAPYDWATKGPKGNPFEIMAKAMFEAAEELGADLRWGADWDQDGKPYERGESDSPHFELHGV